MTNCLRPADPVGRLLTDPEVATPAFVIDDAKLQVNLDCAKEKAARLGVTLRPHLKTHKSIEIARRQMLSPEGPATVSTLAEARYFAENGVKDLIYAVGIAPQKLADVAAIREAGCDLKIILDNVAAAKAVSAFCAGRGVTIPVLIEVDCDGHRSGVRPESELLIEIARALKDGAELAGVLTHAGASYDVENLAVIRWAAANERDGIVTAANRLREAGFEVRVVLPDYKAKKLEEGGYNGKTVVMGIRPEDIGDSQIEIEAHKDAVFETDVTGYELLGSEVLLYFNVAGTAMTAKVDSRTTARMGDHITLAIDPEKIHCFDIHSRIRETEQLISVMIDKI